MDFPECVTSLMKKKKTNWKSVMRNIVINGIKMYLCLWDLVFICLSGFVFHIQELSAVIAEKYFFFLVSDVSKVFVFGNCYIAGGPSSQNGCQQCLLCMGKKRL